MPDQIKKMEKTKKLNRKILIPSVVVIAILALSIYGSSQVFANSASEFPPIVQNLAKRFNLNPSDVNEVFEQEKAVLWQRKKQTISDRLELAVQKGLITESQKQAIMEKRDELQADRTARNQQIKSDLQQWMKSMGINAKALLPYLGIGGFGRNGFQNSSIGN